jgi:PadR family transcriptional regulator, regulatory protein PadR
MEALPGTLDMPILQTLQWGPQYGHGIVPALWTNSGEVLQVETGSLYPALHRLERQGWVRSEWKQTRASNGPVATAFRQPARSGWLPTGALGTGS